MVVFISLILWHCCAYGQEGFKFNYNIDNGLPSNNVYVVLTDKLGYMWLCTPNGMVRYNGYDFRVFNTSNGLPTNDVWSTAEDAVGRIWVGGISDEMGYVYNNKYHSTTSVGYSKTIYPKFLTPVGDGITFSTNDFGISSQKSKYDQMINSYLFAIGNDKTIKYYPVDLLRFDHNSPKEERVISQQWVTLNNDSLFIYNNCVYRFSVTGAKIKMDFITKLVGNTAKELRYRGSIIDNSYLLDAGSGGIVSYNLLTGQRDSVHLDGTENTFSGIYAFYWTRNNKNNFYKIAKENIYRFAILNNKILFQGCKKLTALINDTSIDGSKITVVCDNEFWGLFISTSTNGLNICNPASNHFHPNRKIDLKYFKLVGNEPGKKSFWWNSNHTLAIIDSDLTVSSYDYKNLERLNKILYYRNDSFLLFSSNVNWLTESGSVVERKNAPEYIFDLKAIVITENDSFCSIGSQEFLSGNLSHGSWNRNVIDREKYLDLTFDPIRKNTWVYNAYKIHIYSPTHSTIYNKENLKAIGVTKIEKIAIDPRYSNIFVLQNGPSGYELLLFDSSFKRSQAQFTNTNLKKTQMLIHENKLILAGEYGVIVSKILGTGRISKPVIFQNLKGACYKEVTGIAILGNNILLNTNKGALTASMPSDSEFNDPASKTPINYNVVLYCEDTVIRLLRNDTIKLNQKKPSIQFDVINPSGNGAVHYSYQIGANSNWQELNANELTMPPTVVPGRYYKISLKINDDVWRSDEHSFIVYVKPYWWQLMLRSKLFWSGAVILILALLAALVRATQRLTNRKNEEKNLRQEMELKSVHAQINPHFIFNTLNTALYFIKKKKIDEAYDHVSKFSVLLRAYIKSSRSKYISIADEVVNISNYIQLQQTRFEDKFSFEIIVDNKINASNVKIPALLLQPIVENSIDHGLFHKEGHGYLKIEFKKISLTNEIQCIVEDNGVGRKAAKQITAGSVLKSESYGESLIKDLVAIFNNYEQTGISIEYIDKQEPETGTKVIIDIKNPVNEK